MTASDSQEFVDYTEPVSDDEDNEENRLRYVVNRDGEEADWADLPKGAAAEAKAFRDSNAGKETPDKKPVGSSQKVKEIFTKLTPANLARLLNSKYTGEHERTLNSGADEGEMNESGFSLKPGRIEYVSSFRAQPGKRIAIPVRIEPKVFFANERTSTSPSLPRLVADQTQCSRGSSSRSSCLPSVSEFSPSRSRTTVRLAAKTISRLTISQISPLPPPRPSPSSRSSRSSTRRTRTCGECSRSGTSSILSPRVVLTLPSKREAVDYHDYFGPSVLCGVLGLAVVVNFSLRAQAGF